jgi:peptidoglycan/xylan/chitin deacetylase (PgdA/CDA1 family)
VFPRVLLGAALVAHAAPAPAAVVPGLAGALGIQTRADEAPGVVLTFDDGPHPQGTPAVLDALERTGALATFFLVGEQVARRPVLAAEIAGAGHGIALHCHRHRNALLLGPRALRDDLRRGSEEIERATGRRPVAWRPPYGVFTTAALAVARREGRHPILWSKWGRDWRRSATPDSITALATEGIARGDVVLLHDADYYSAPGSWTRTAAALPMVLDRLGELGLPAVALPDRSP